MTLYSAVNPYPVILNQVGGGLNGGKVYIGVAGQDPEVNPVAVYWDAAGANPAAQPLTTIGGYIWNAGAPAQVYGPSEYSMRVRDRGNQQVFYDAQVQTLAAATLAAITAIFASLPDEADGDPIPAPGSGLPYLSGGVMKIA